MDSTEIPNFSTVHRIAALQLSIQNVTTQGSHTHHNRNDGWHGIRWIHEYRVEQSDTKPFRIKKSLFVRAILKRGVTTPFRTKIKQDAEGVKGIFTAFRRPWFGGATQGFDLKVSGQLVYFKFGGAYQADPTGTFVESAQKAIKQMEVYQITTGSSTTCAAPSSSSANNDFAKNVNDAMEYKQVCLPDLKYEIEILESAFQDEESFVSFVANENHEDIVTLNVSGTKMMVAKNTLMIAKKSSLASQIAHCEQTNETLTPEKILKEWSHEDVVAWMNRLEGVPESVVSIFAENQISGRELIALGKEGMTALGVTRIGTFFLLLNGIKQMEKETTHNKEILIDHSPYCFEKIIDQLRLMRAYVDGRIKSKPASPVVRKCEKGRFEKLVNHYFPDESSRSIALGNGKTLFIEF